MGIIAKGQMETIELHDNLITIKGLSTLYFKKVYELGKVTFKVKKFKQAGKFFMGVLQLEAYSKSSKKLYTLQYDQNEQDNFNEIVNILQYGKSEDGIVFSAKGIDGLIELYNDRLIIKRDSNSSTGFWVHGLKGNKEVWLKHITAVQIKMPGTITRGFVVKGMEHNGYIQLTIPGGIESKGGVINATGDENTVFFNKDQADNFEKLKNIISEKINGNVIQRNLGVKENNINDLDMLEKLAQLRENGIITEEEFIQKKKQILGI